MAYSQGLPLAITIIALVVDKVGRSNDGRPQQYLPNMGVYSCFLDNGILGQGKTYFAHPIFIYFQSFMLVLIINFTC